MRDTVQARPPLVVGANDIPRGMFAVGCIEHQVPGTGEVIPPAKGLQVHGTELPLTDLVVDARLKAALLLRLSDFQPVLDEDNPRVDDVLLHLRTERKEAVMLFFCAEAHHVFHTGAVVPAPVKDHDLAGRGEMLHVALHVHLRFFPVGWRGEGHQAKDARTYAFRYCAYGATLAGGIASLEHDYYPQALVLCPVLQLAEFCLELPKLPFIFFATQLSAAVLVVVLC